MIKMIIPSLTFIQIVTHVLGHQELSFLFSQLFGEFSKTSQSWSDGLLPKFLRTASKLQHDSKEDEKTCDTIQYWFVFDGPLDRKLTDPLESLLDNKNELCLINGERIKPPGMC